MFLVSASTVSRQSPKGREKARWKKVKGELGFPAYSLLAEGLEDAL